MPAPSSPSWRHRLHEIIFEADTFLGKLFDIILLLLILGSVLTVMLESVQEISRDYADFFFYAEWGFTLLFTLEFILRLVAVRQPWQYVRSFYGVIDLLAILPTYISLIVAGTQYLLVVRAMRLLRVFRIFKLTQFMRASDTIVEAMRASRTKITVFLAFVVMLVTIIGSVLYVVESGQDSGFTSIPRSIYWAVVTLTTVGYGDIAPATPLGQFLATCVMILGYAVIAVPTGIVSSEFSRKAHHQYANTQACPNCGREGHDSDAIHCKYCGATL